MNSPLKNVWRVYCTFAQTSQQWSEGELLVWTELSRFRNQRHSGPSSHGASGTFHEAQRHTGQMNRSIRHQPAALNTSHPSEDTGVNQQCLQDPSVLSGTLEVIRTHKIIITNTETCTGTLKQECEKRRLLERWTTINPRGSRSSSRSTHTHIHTASPEAAQTSQKSVEI